MSMVNVKEQDLAVFSACSREQLMAMAAAGVQLRECYRLLEKTGANVVGQILAVGDSFYEWNHYPEGDVFDRESASQYYYHAHRGAALEHGHFHTFLRAAGIKKGVRPAPYDGAAERPLGADAIAHLISISMNEEGYPIGLFAVNRWVTGETFYAAEDVIAMLPDFRIDHTFPCLAANMWITAMVRLFMPQIAALLRERDLSIAAWQKQHPDRDVYEDRELEMTSYLPISVSRQIAAIDKLLGR